MMTRMVIVTMMETYSPPTIPEKYVHINGGNNVDIVHVRYHYHLCWCDKYDGRWQENSNTYIYYLPLAVSFQ